MATVGSSPGSRRCAARSAKGATREQVRANVIDALRAVLEVRLGAPPELSEPADSDSLELTIAA